MPLARQVVLTAVVLFLSSLVLTTAQETKMIYVSPNDPMVNCSIGQNRTGTQILGGDPSISGYDIDLLRYPSAAIFLS